MDLDSFENGLRTALANEKAGSVEIRRVGGAELYRGLSAQDVEVVAPAGALSRALARQCRYVRIAGREPLGARARARLRVFSKASGAASRAAPIRGSEAIPFPGLVFDPLSWISVARLHDLQRMQNIANRRLGELEVIKRQVDAFQSMERSVYELKDSLESVKLPGTADLKVVALIPGDAWTARIRRDDNLSGDPDSLSAGSRLHDGVVKSIEGDHLAVEVEVPVYGKAPVKRLLRFAPPAPALPRITVAADTTRLTSPLLADGTPDYVRWLNLKAGCLALAIPCAPGAP